MPLSISVLPGSPVPIYRQIVDQVGAGVVAGQLGEDEPLPPVRSLASRLRVNVNTVAKAYSQLVQEGIIESRGTRGMFVVPRRRLHSRPERRRRIEPSLNAYVSEALRLGYTKEEILAQIEDRVDELSPDS